MTQEPAMSADAEAEIRAAREIIAGFLLWHAPAYKRLPSVSLVKLLDDAKRFMDPPVKAPQCKRCNDLGWLEPIEGRDGSYITSRPCKCDAGDRASRLA
jgi:hypothetical protein